MRRLLIGLLILPSLCFSEALLVVVSIESDILRLSRSEVARYYMLEKRFWPNGERVFPVLPSSLRGEVIEKLIQVTSSRYNERMLALKQNRGIERPAEFDTERSVVAQVLRSPAVIGVVSEDYFRNLGSSKKDRLRVVFK